jgi:hypothetical protein
MHPIASHYTDCAVTANVIVPYLQFFFATGIKNFYVFILRLQVYQTQGTVALFSGQDEGQSVYKMLERTLSELAPKFSDSYLASALIQRARECLICQHCEVVSGKVL